MDTLWPHFVRRRLDPASSYGLRLTLFLLAVGLVAIPFSWLVVEVTSDDDVVEFDMAAAEKALRSKSRFRGSRRS